MAQTLEDLQLENQELRTQLAVYKKRIDELEAYKKEYDDMKYKEAHDNWVSGSRNGSRGVIKR